MPRTRRADHRQYLMTLDGVRIGTSLTAGGGTSLRTTEQMVPSDADVAITPFKRPEKNNPPEISQPAWLALSNPESELPG